jgi:uncharacterized 2Fe-2S/4Fe-4S cluster protein (DUF4445 family)
MVPKGVSLLEASRLLGVDIEALCGEKRVCGKCKVRIEEGFFENFGIRSGQGHVSPWQEEEAKFISPVEREEGFRLGCCAKIEGDVLVFVPEASRAGKQIVSKAARPILIDHNPAVKHYCVELSPPTIEDPRADLERLLDALREGHGLRGLTMDLQALRTLPRNLRKGDWKVTVSVWMDREILRVRPGRAEHALGMAFDIGTTTVAGYLCSLSTMEVLDTQSLMNPQCRYGEDVMSRITYHSLNPGGLRKMSQDIVEALNTLVAEAIRTAAHRVEPPGGVEKTRERGNEDDRGARESQQWCGEDVEDVTIVCNTAMHHILLQIDPESLGLAPFPPAVHRGLDIKARDLGLGVNPGAYVHILPNEAGFVGADNVGVLIVEEPHKGEEIQLIIDIGTNGELVLGNRERLLSCSCATGPAFEGAQLRCGMRAAPGAIERIRIDPETHEVDYKVIGRDAWRGYSEPGEMRVRGICGSGVLDLFAELYRTGVILKSGRFNPDEKSGRLRTDPETGQPEFVVAWKEETSIGRDVVITQKDVRQVQLAKAALYCGCKLMMRRLGVERADRVKIAGAFGTHVDPEKALVMGLFPDCAIERIVSVGNAAGDGARAALLNVAKREEAARVAEKVEYIELTIEEDFQEQFMAALAIPHMNDPFPNLKGRVPDRILDQ